MTPNESIVKPKARNKSGKKLRSKLTAAEIRRIERSTPFIKKGRLLAASEANDELEETLSAMKLTDLVIDDSKWIGKGAYGFVYLAVHKPTGVQVAVKKLDKELLKKKTLALLLKSEIEIHKRLKHDNIVRLYADL